MCQKQTVSRKLLHNIIHDLLLLLSLETFCQRMIGSIENQILRTLNFYNLFLGKVKSIHALFQIYVQHLLLKMLVLVT